MSLSPIHVGTLPGLMVCRSYICGLSHCRFMGSTSLLGLGNCFVKVNSLLAPCVHTVNLYMHLQSPIVMQHNIVSGPEIGIWFWTKGEELFSPMW